MDSGHTPRGYTRRIIVFNFWGQPSALIKSAIFSAMLITVTLILALTQSGIMEASPTLRLLAPRTFPYWSTTAIGSDSGPIFAVQDT